MRFFLEAVSYEGRPEPTRSILGRSIRSLPCLRMRLWKWFTEFNLSQKKKGGRFPVKSLWNSFKIAFAMFSKIPMPQAEWTERKYAVYDLLFPFVGSGSRHTHTWCELAGQYFGFSTGFMAMALILVPVFADRWNPCGWTFGYLGCFELLERQRKTSGDT